MQRSGFRIANPVGVYDGRSKGAEFAARRSPASLSQLARAAPARLLRVDISFESRAFVAESCAVVSLVGAGQSHVRTS